MGDITGGTFERVVAVAVPGRQPHVGREQQRAEALALAHVDGLVGEQRRRGAGPWRDSTTWPMVFASAPTSRQRRTPTGRGRRRRRGSRARSIPAGGGAAEHRRGPARRSSAARPRAPPPHGPSAVRAVAGTQSATARTDPARRADAARGPLAAPARCERPVGGPAVISARCARPPDRGRRPASPRRPSVTAPSARSVTSRTQIAGLPERAEVDLHRVARRASGWTLGREDLPGDDGRTSRRPRGRRRARRA